jgi:lipopolysaccharide/colanic/teichoic acid biosynthesis glycosyltransferase
MILQSIAIPLVIFLVVNLESGGTAWYSVAARWTCDAVIYLTVLVTIGSALPYIFGFRRIGAGARA